MLQWVVLNLVNLLVDSIKHLLCLCLIFGWLVLRLSQQVLMSSSCDKLSSVSKSCLLLSSLDSFIL